MIMFTEQEYLEIQRERRELRELRKMLLEVNALISRALVEASSVRQPGRCIRCNREIDAAERFCKECI